MDFGLAGLFRPESLNGMVEAGRANLRGERSVGISSIDIDPRLSKIGRTFLCSALSSFDAAFSALEMFSTLLVIDSFSILSASDLDSDCEDMRHFIKACEN